MAILSIYVSDFLGLGVVVSFSDTDQATSNESGTY